MKFTTFLTQVILAYAHHREEKLVRRPRDLLYWNRMYNTLHPFSQAEIRPSPSFLCKAMQHLLRRAKTGRELKKLHTTMIKNGCYN